MALSESPATEMMVDRLRELKQRIESACEQAGRDSRSVRLVAISKGHDPAKVAEAYGLGLKDFGENYATEFREKQTSLQAQCPDIQWHFVGGIQSNKLRIISAASWVHTLGEMRHAEALSALVSPNAPVKALLQVNLSKEKHRSGVFPEMLLERYTQIAQLPGLNLCGLMTIAPLSGEPPAFWFKQMHDLKIELEAQLGNAVPELSMGMSEDFEDA